MKFQHILFSNENIQGTISYSFDYEGSVKYYELIKTIGQ